MIERYSRPEMAALWTQEHRWQLWIQVELEVLKVQQAMGLVPKGSYEEAKPNASVSAERIDALEVDLKHDVLAFLTNLNESVGPVGRYIHLGMTSSDLIDTALSLQLQDSGSLLRDALDRLRQAIWKQAQAHKQTLMIGRSHGIHGEPITFGLKLLVWYEELNRQRERLNHALRDVRVGQISGAMGTYAHLSPEVEATVCQNLGLEPAKVSTQILQRDRHAYLMSCLGLLASSLEKFAVEIRHLQRTDVLEVEEPFTKGQKGSSAMPHKRNPVASENITGLARLIRSFTLPAMENIALWHERDISHSSVERIIFPDAFIALHYALHRFAGVMENLQVYPETMRRNMDCYGGIVFSQRVLLALIEARLSREEAYARVQRNAMAAWNTPQGNFKQNLLNDPDVSEVLSPEAIEACFNPQAYLQSLDTIYQRFEAP
jgi:adenylosuccinate lyase